jgi:hypothetical protein
LIIDGPAIERAGGAKRESDAAPQRVALPVGRQQQP